MSDLNRVDIVLEELTQWQYRAENLLQVLVGIQARLHHIPDDVSELLSHKLSIPVSTIRGLISYYSFLDTRHRGEYDIRLSNDYVDQLNGSHQLAGQMAHRLKTCWGETRDDHRVSLAFTSCTGLSDQGPAGLVNGVAVPRLDTGKIDLICDLVERAVPLDAWPHSLFHVEENLRNPGLLLGDWFADGMLVRQAVTSDPDEVLTELRAAGLRGRGGAGFSTADKWQVCRESGQGSKVVVCNADEGEPGAFKDRLLLQAYAARVFEGMTLCAATVGADCGFLYLRGEYFYLKESLEAELESRRQRGLLGDSIAGCSGFNFDIRIHMGAGAYVCGEESALIESLEGQRGVPRIRPPYPATCGYLGRPTIVNNVETFVAAAAIIANGRDWFVAQGSHSSSGSKLLSISGDCSKPGVYEFPFGVTVTQVLEACGADDTLFVQIGGASGQMLVPDDFGRTIAFEDISTDGSVMIFNRHRDVMQLVANFTQFFAHESCGFCTPCRVGTSLLKIYLDKFAEGKLTATDLEAMQELAQVMQSTSHCGLGQSAAKPFVQSLQLFPQLYRERIHMNDAELADSHNQVC